MVLLGYGCSREAQPKAPSPAGQTYVTRESLEPDKLASIWLIKRHVNKDARFVFVADGVPLTNGIPFDTPEAEFRRYANLSCFESILKKHQITNFALRHLGEIIHDIEINYWGEKRFAESDPLNRELREVIKTNSMSRETCLSVSFAVFDRLVRPTNATSPAAESPGK
jgi:hypothetical protein